MRPPAPWGVLDVELAERHGLFDPGIERPTLVILRRHGAVLGRAQIMPSDLPMSPREFAEFAGRACGASAVELLRLGTCEESARPPGTSRPPSSPDAIAATLEHIDALLSARRARPVPCTGSIIICTRHRPHDLAVCLEAVAPEIATGREVIVVDYGPDDQTLAVVEQIGARYVPEPEAGIAAARNRGIANTMGEVAIFIDDTARPEPGWADMLLRRFDDPAVAAVTGLLLPVALDTEAQIGCEYDLGFGDLALLPLAFDVDVLEGWPGSPSLRDIGSGANMAIRCSHARSLGGFDERIGFGAASCGFDVTEFWHRILLAGWRIRYEPLAVVRHKHCETMPELGKIAYCNAKGQNIGLFLSFARSGWSAHLRRGFRDLLRWNFRRPRRTPLRFKWNALRGYVASLRHVGLLRAAPGDTGRLEKARDGG